MKHFQFLASGIDVTPLLHALYLNPGLWNECTIRQDFPGSPHDDTETILLRFNQITTVEEVTDDKECFDYPAYAMLPEARQLVNSLVARVQGERIGRVMIVRLPAAGKIAEHRDEGSPASYYERYHIALQALPGVLFHAGDETVEMRTGELWWFNNREIHSLENKSPDDRIHLIIDIKTRSAPIEIGAFHG